jgi:hypothetical protein
MKKFFVKTILVEVFGVKKSIRTWIPSENTSSESLTAD